MTIDGHDDILKTGAVPCAVYSKNIELDTHSELFCTIFFQFAKEHYWDTLFFDCCHCLRCQILLQAALLMFFITSISFNTFMSTLLDYLPHIQIGVIE